MKAFRRTVIVICAILLIPLIFCSISEGKYFYKELKAKVDNGIARVIEVNKKLKIDDDAIIIQRIIITDKNTYVRVRYVQSQPGWSFPLSSIVLYDNKGKVDYYAGEGSGRLWGEEGINEYNQIGNDCKKIIIKLQWYDRKQELDIPYEGSGSI